MLRRSATLATCRPRFVAGIAALLVVLAGFGASGAPAVAQSASVAQVASDCDPLCRTAGSDRVLTAVAVSKRFWPSSRHVLLATAGAFPDALAGSALAATLDAPLLLTPGGVLPDAVAAELERLGAGEVWVLGGPGAVGPEVEAALRGRGLGVRRLSGPDRFATAARVALAATEHADHVVVALGEHPSASAPWADAVAAGALVGDGVPLLLTRPDRVPDATADALRRLGAREVTVVGGRAAVSDQVVAALGAEGVRVRRLSGADRFETSAVVAAEALAAAAEAGRPLVFATGGAYPDALAAGALAGRLDTGLLLTPRDGLPSAPRWRELLGDSRVRGGVLVGGTAAVSEQVADELQVSFTAMARKPRHKPSPSPSPTADSGSGGSSGSTSPSPSPSPSDSVSPSPSPSPSASTSPSPSPSPSPAPDIDALHRRVRAELAVFTDWLASAGAKGFIGEVGWPAGADVTRWNALAQRWYADAAASGLWVTSWTTGEWWPGSYSLLAYDNPAGGALSSAGPQAAVVEAQPSAVLRGVNVAGAEFGTPGSLTGTSSFSNTSPGSYDTNWHYDTQASFDYLAARGVGLVRLPFRWERIQPRLGGELDTTELGRLGAAVARARAAGLDVILDVHNYGAYYLSDGTKGVRRAIGSAEVSVAHFADLWARLSRHFKGVPGIAGYGLMNEPVGMPGATTRDQAALWERASQAALDAIRAQGDTRTVLVPGYLWSGAWRWSAVHPTPWITDPAGAFRYEAHHYFDGDRSGTYASSYDTEVAAAAAQGY